MSQWIGVEQIFDNVYASSSSSSSSLSSSSLSSVAQPTIFYFFESKDSIAEDGRENYKTNQKIYIKPEDYVRASWFHTDSSLNNNNINSVTIKAYTEDGILDTQLVHDYSFVGNTVYTDLLYPSINGDKMYRIVFILNIVEGGTLTFVTEKIIAIPNDYN